MGYDNCFSIIAASRPRVVGFLGRMYSCHGGYEGWPWDNCLVVFPSSSSFSSLLDLFFKDIIGTSKNKQPIEESANQVIGLSDRVKVPTALLTPISFALLTMAGKGCLCALDEKRAAAIIDSKRGKPFNTMRLAIRIPPTKKVYRVAKVKPSRIKNEQRISRGSLSPKHWHHSISLDFKVLAEKYETVFLTPSVEI